MFTADNQTSFKYNVVVVLNFGSKQESGDGHWHIPIASEHQYEEDRTWLCVTRPNSSIVSQSQNVGAHSAKGNHVAYFDMYRSHTNCVSFRS